jgi:hypothetical protein
MCTRLKKDQLEKSNHSSRSDQLLPHLFVSLHPHFETRFFNFFGKTAQARSAEFISKSLRNNGLEISHSSLTIHHSSSSLP